MRNGSPPGDYEIGFGRPPKAHRFQPGKSGNPSGRRKRGNPGLRSAILAELEKPLTYMTKEGRRKARAADLIARLAVADAARGDRHSRKFLIDISKQDHSVGPENSVQAETERAASAFDVKFASALAGPRREAEAELEAQSNQAKTEEDGAGEG